LREVITMLHDAVPACGHRPGNPHRAPAWDCPRADRVIDAAGCHVALSLLGARPHLVRTGRASRKMQVRRDDIEAVPEEACVDVAGHRG
jgi:hypothetical protein